MDAQAPHVNPYAELDFCSHLAGNPDGVAYDRLCFGHEALDLAGSTRRMVKVLVPGCMAASASLLRGYVDQLVEVKAARPFAAAVLPAHAEPGAHPAIAPARALE